METEDIWEALHFAARDSLPTENRDPMDVSTRVTERLEGSQTVNFRFPHMEGGNLAWLDNPDAMACEL